VTDPYNSYQSHPPVAPIVRAPVAPRPQRDNISRLDISDKWKARFRAIEAAGGPDLPNFRDLPMSDRRIIQFNWIAFFFGPFYYLAKGLWRQAVVYVLLAIACVLIMEAIGLGKFGRAVGYGFAAVYAMRANLSYYKKLVLGEAPWV
jgi:hypothetical protein